MSKLVPVHGGKLVPRLLTGDKKIAEIKKAESLPKVMMSSRETSDLIMIGMGAFSPLEGFMGQADYLGVVENMHLANGILWPIPITLSVSTERAETLNAGDEVTLVDEESGEAMATMVVDEKYTYDKENEAKCVFRTTDKEHPGVAKVYAQGDVLLGGKINTFSEGEYPEIYGDDYAHPAQTRAIFEERGWSKVAAFQTRNPLHRSHEYCTKIALEVSDGLLLHPLVGKLKKGDIPAETRMKCYDTILEKYYPSDRVVMKVYPMEMRYGGPREAVLHAVFRQNFGCSYMIIGRDHAGVGSYYGPFDAQEIFNEFDPSELAIQPLNIDWTFYCYKCEGMASMKTCPHGKEDHCLISGTKIREMLANGEHPPKEFGRPEVIDILIDYYKNKAE
ncbi:sulfate adenylyltransferase [bacterium]|nr:sulfate adenylyltransferase [bacterium]